MRTLTEGLKSFSKLGSDISVINRLNETTILQRNYKNMQHCISTRMQINQEQRVYHYLPIKA